MISLVRQARDRAGSHLAQELPRRWLHVQAVAAKAGHVAAVLDDDGDRAALVAAAWLHDIGYANDLLQTGFHPLDGALFLRSEGFDPRVTDLVAHHSCALIEADERGLYDELATAFDRENSATADALWYCDMTTGPDGEDLDVNARLDEIRQRYGQLHVVTRFIDRAEDEITAAVRRTEQRLINLAGSHPM